MINLAQLTIIEAHRGLVSGTFTVRELVQAYLDAIKEKDGDIHAYLEVYDDVMKQADHAQTLVSPDRPLAGIPLAVKDNLLIQGKHASSASKILENYVAPYDATAIKKLKEAGVVFLGRVNMDEFAMGGSTENSAYGVTKNPHDLSRVAGGSSGGSAASVAGNMALAALGSDTGGSVRQPASFCGVVGLKPTYGSISRHGLMAMGSSLDIIGPITKTVTDAELIFNTIQGADIYDSTSHNSKSKTNKARVLGIPRKLLSQGGIHPEVLELFEKAIESYKAHGYEIKDIDLPHSEYALAVYYVLMPAEVSTNLARFDGVRYGMHKDGANGIQDYFETRGAYFGREARRRIMLGTYVLSSGYYDAYYNKALAVRELLKADFKKAFARDGYGVDAILMPTTPSHAFKIGEKASDPVSMYLEDIFTVTANLVGIPALSIPLGTISVSGTEHKLPTGLQLLADYSREDILFDLGKTYLGEV